MYELLHYQNFEFLSKACIIRCLKDAGNFGTNHELRADLQERLESVCRQERWVHAEEMYGRPLKQERMIDIQM
jgi:hypothetical protein